ncbi:non-ribosomal peptide synthetase [Paenibacillus borealis]|uniref:non-ribosomal peptide synthetase n=1 Tax=Paenibacillus borealis TaxID=160799 RepID=UPI0006942559|nr:non-ribosomal peptide synthetase [Paenibacillus borealis]
MALQNDYQGTLVNPNDTYRIYPLEKTIHMLFEEQVTRTPDKTALGFKGKRLTYEELNKQANRLARLLRSKGVKTDSIVSVMVERSMDMLIAVIAILKAGGAFLPIDPHFPASRIEYMLLDSTTKLLITQDSLSDNICASYDGEILSLDQNTWSHEDDSNLTHTGSGNDLAYVIYTSGSTGKPKGVMIEHQSVHNFIIGMTEAIDLDPVYTIVSVTTMSFDIFIFETLLPLTRGLKIVLADPKELYSSIGISEINIIQTTPSTMLLLLNDPANEDIIMNLRVIMLGGEPFPAVLLDKLKVKTSAKIYNMYGPTETTIWSSVKDLTHTNDITLGNPIANTKLHVLNESLIPVRDGEIGELFISGDGLAREYLNKPELTDERFIRNSSEVPGARMYRTGDLVRRNGNGELTFHGRVDNQVKIRGFRIELGDIEEHLSKFDGLKECAVTAKVNKSGDFYLVAYYVAEKQYEASHFIRYLSDFIPEYMIPGFYLHIDSIPRTPNGKLDRRSLPEPDNSRPMLETNYVTPITLVEKKIVEIWMKILGMDLVGIHDNFFELGGNSILLSVAHAEIKRNIHHELALPDLFSNPTVSTLAGYISKAVNSVTSKPIEGLQFPTDFLTCTRFPGDTVGLTHTFNQDICHTLTQICGEGIDLEDIFAGAFAYVLSETCSSSDIILNIPQNDGVNFISIETNLDKFDAFEEIFKHLHYSQRGANPRNQFSIEELSNAAWQGGVVHPVFGKFSLMQQQFTELFGLVGCIKEANGQIELIFRHDGRMQAPKMKEVFKNYIKAIKAIANLNENR